MHSASRAELHAAIWASAGRLGLSAPLVADDILSEVFPETTRAAKEEEATPYLRNGFVDYVKGVIRRGTGQDDQIGFEDIDAAYQPYVRALRSNRYYVPDRGVYVHITELIARPILLDDARKHLRRKGVETIEEAERLDQLYLARTGGGTAVRKRRSPRLPTAGHHAEPAGAASP